MEDDLSWNFTGDWPLTILTTFLTPFRSNGGEVPRYNFSTSSSSSGKRETPSGMPEGFGGLGRGWGEPNFQCLKKSPPDFQRLFLTNIYLQQKQNMLNNNSTTCFRTKPKKTQFLRHTNQRCVFKNWTYSDVVIQSLKVVELMSTFDISEINLIGVQPPDRCWSICSPFRNGKMVIQKTSIYSKVVLVVMQLQGPTLSTNPRDPGSPYLRMVSWNPKYLSFRFGDWDDPNHLLARWARIPTPNHLPNGMIRVHGMAGCHAPVIKLSFVVCGVEQSWMVLLDRRRGRCRRSGEFIPLGLQYTTEN